MALTKRQEDTLNYIKLYISQYGYPPTVREIAEKLEVSSPATIHAHLEKLEEKGYIKKNNSKNRAIELQVENEYIDKGDLTVEIPLLGTVTAGNPIEAIEQPDTFFQVPSSYLTNKEDFFALRVRGDSMVNVGIFDDDIVIVEKGELVKNGDIVVAMTDEYEVTLKRFYREKDHIRLQPENDEYEPIIMKSGKILGRASSLYRKL